MRAENVTVTMRDGSKMGAYIVNRGTCPGASFDDRAILNSVLRSAYTNRDQIRSDVNGRRDPIIVDNLFPPKPVEKPCGNVHVDEIRARTTVHSFKGTGFDGLIAKTAPKAAIVIQTCGLLVNL